MEIYIDRKVLSQMNTMNAMYKFAEKIIKTNAANDHAKNADRYDGRGLSDGFQ